MKKLLFIIAIFFFGFQYTSAQSANEIGKSTTEQIKIKVFPNPATNVVNVLGLQNSNRAAIMISDTYGNTVQEHHWRIKNNAVNIPVTSLDSGIYIITIHSEEQQVQTKFYKQ